MATKHDDIIRRFAPIIFDGYYIETHKSKNGAKSDMIKFLKELNLEVESC